MGENTPAIGALKVAATPLRHRRPPGLEVVAAEFEALPTLLPMAPRSGRSTLLRPSRGADSDALARPRVKMVRSAPCRRAG